MRAILFKKKSFLQSLRLSWMFLILLLVLVFLYLKIVPFGEMTYSKNYAGWLRSGKGFIYNFTPAERIDEESGRLPKLVGDPVYFSVFTPRTFSTARVTIQYINNLNDKNNIIEAGVLADNIIWRYELKPLENRILDNLFSDWHTVNDQDVTLLQTDNNYVKVEDFLHDLESGSIKDCPAGPTSCLATYNYSPNFNFRLSDMRESLPATVPVPLRGAHTMFVYINGEPLRLDLDFVDLNQDKSADPIQIILSRDGKVIAQASLPDNNNQGASGKEEVKKLFLEKRDLAPGVYKVEIKITDDTVIKNLRCSLSRFVFANKIWPVSAGKDIKVFTDTSYIQVKAVGPASVQKIIFDGKEFDLAEPYRQFEFIAENKSGTKAISFSKDDVILENNGVFSFSSGVIFNPMLKKIDSHFSSDSEIKYILADYESPAEDGQYKIASAEFNLYGAYREKGKYSFMLSVPGLKVDDKAGGNIEIKKITIEFLGRNIWQKIFNRGK